MKTIIPKKLKQGDLIRVVSPARSFKMLSEETINIAVAAFKEMGLRVSY